MSSLQYYASDDSAPTDDSHNRRNEKFAAGELYAQLPLWIMTVGHLARMQLVSAKILITLLSYADFHTGECFPSQEAIAKRAGVSRKSVVKAIKELTKIGVLTVWQSAFRSTKTYRINKQQPRGEAIRAAKNLSSQKLQEESQNDATCVTDTQRCVSNTQRCVRKNRAHGETPQPVRSTNAHKLEPINENQQPHNEHADALRILIGEGFDCQTAEQLLNNLPAPLKRVESVVNQCNERQAKRSVRNRLGLIRYLLCRASQAPQRNCPPDRVAGISATAFQESQKLYEDAQRERARIETGTIRFIKSMEKVPKCEFETIASIAYSSLPASVRMGIDPKSDPMQSLAWRSKIKLLIERGQSGTD